MVDRARSSRMKSAPPLADACSVRLYRLRCSRPKASGNVEESADYSRLASRSLKAVFWILPFALRGSGSPTMTTVSGTL
jgi:hypothetical protein